MCFGFSSATWINNYILSMSDFFLFKEHLKTYTLEDGKKKQLIIITLS